MVGTSLSINEISPSWSLSLDRSQSTGNCVVVTTCFTSGISKEEFQKDNYWPMPSNKNPDAAVGGD